jgi:hypothetical protein
VSMAWRGTSARPYSLENYCFSQLTEDTVTDLWKSASDTCDEQPAEMQRTDFPVEGTSPPARVEPQPSPFPADPPPPDPWTDEEPRQGLTLVHFSAHRKRFLWDRGAFWGCLGGVTGH